MERIDESKKRVERRVVLSSNRASGDKSDFWINFNPVECVVGIEYTVVNNLSYSIGGTLQTDPIAIYIENWSDSQHSAGWSYWRLLDVNSNVRTIPDWETFPSWKTPQTINTLHIKLYSALSGLPITDAQINGNYLIEIEFYCIKK